MKQEIILCAAIWYKNVPTAKLNPVNIQEGVVLCGYRHGHIIYQMLAMTGYRTVTYAIDGTGEYQQGFLTNTNRFVGRREAYMIAYEANQIIGPNKGCPTNEIGLTSEDLYSEDLY